MSPHQPGRLSTVLIHLSTPTRSIVYRPANRARMFDFFFFYFSSPSSPRHIPCRSIPTLLAPPIFAVLIFARIARMESAEDLRRTQGAGPARVWDGIVNHVTWRSNRAQFHRTHENRAAQRLIDLLYQDGRQSIRLSSILGPTPPLIDWPTRSTIFTRDDEMKEQNLGVGSLVSVPVVFHKQSSWQAHLFANVGMSQADH